MNNGCSDWACISGWLACTLSEIAFPSTMEADLPTLLSQVCSGGVGWGAGGGDTLMLVLHSFFPSLAVPLYSSVVAVCLILLSFPLGSLSFCLSFSFFSPLLSPYLWRDFNLSWWCRTFFFFIQKMLMMEIIKTFPVLFLFGCFPHSGFLFLSLWTLPSGVLEICRVAFLFIVVFR